MCPQAITGAFGSVARKVPIKIRHPTQNVRNSDSSALCFLVGTRGRGGNTYPTGLDTMLLLKTSYVV